MFSFVSAFLTALGDVRVKMSSWRGVDFKWAPEKEIRIKLVSYFGRTLKQSLIRPWNHLLHLIGLNISKSIKIIKSYNENSVVWSVLTCFRFSVLLTPLCGDAIFSVVQIHDFCCFSIVIWLLEDFRKKKRKGKGGKLPRKQTSPNHKLKERSERKWCEQRGMNSKPSECNRRYDNRPPGPRAVVVALLFSACLSPYAAILSPV